MGVPRSSNDMTVRHVSVHYRSREFDTENSPRQAIVGENRYNNTVLPSDSHCNHNKTVMNLGSGKARVREGSTKERHSLSM